MAKEYDNSAFSYFVISLLGLYAFPMTIYIAYRLLQTFLLKEADPAAQARTNVEADKLRELQRRKRREKNPLRSVAFYVHLGLILFAWSTIAYMFLSVGGESELAGFNPFAILELDAGASESQIRRAYRKMSLKYHPDKTKGDQAAQDRFILISKAYGALTDPVARENYEKYGNPDGRQPMEYGIGLPKWLLDEKNKSSVLMMYLMGLVVLVPTAVLCWYRRSRKYSSGEVMQKTIERFMAAVPANMQPNEVPSLVTHAEEFIEKLKPSSQCLREMARLQKLVDKDRPRKDLKRRKEGAAMDPRLASIEYATVLLYSWFNRIAVRGDQLRDDMHYVVQTTHRLLDAMFKIAVQKHMASLRQPNVPRPSHKTMLNIVGAMQMLVQRMSWNDSELLQLPHFTQREAKHATAGRKGSKGIAEYVELEDKKGLRDLSEEAQSDVLEVCRLLPRLRIEAEVVVEGEEDSELELDAEGKAVRNERKGKSDDEGAEAAGGEGDEGSDTEPSEAPARRVAAERLIGDSDICTLRIRITRENVPEGEEAPAVHAPHYPVEKRETLYLLHVDKSGMIVHNLDVLESQDRTVEHTGFKWRAPPAGEYQTRFILLSDSYIGFDRDLTIDYRVVPQSEVPTSELHNEDEEFDKELQDELHQWEDNDASSDEEDDGDDAAGATPDGEEDASSSDDEE